MKPTDPLQQLKTWKENRAKQNTQKTTQIQPKRATKNQSKKNTQPKEKIAQNANKKVLRGYPQTNRQFNLMMSAIERCKAEFPDSYHHKQQQAKESIKIAKTLRQGINLLEKHYTAKELQSLTRTMKFLAKKFSQVANHVNAVEKGEFTPVTLDSEIE